MGKLIAKVEVTHKGAVYVDDRRITCRSTKWGVHYIIFKARAARKNIMKVLQKNGYGHLRYDPDYMRDENV